MDNVRAMATALGPEDLHRQRWLIRSSLVTMSIDTRGVDYPSYRPPANAEPATARRLLDAADAIGRHLAGIAYHEGDSAEWLGVISDRGEDWSLGPLGADLPTGLSGVALFLGQLGSLTGARDHTTLARAALITALSQVDRGLVARHGGVSGLAGILYAITQLGVLWQDHRLLDTATGLATQVGAIAVEDEQFDVAGGSAGSIAALRALYAVRPAASVLRAVRACADRILAGRQPEGEPGGGVAWLPKSMIEERVTDAPLSGFGHGTAGIAWALLEAAALCGDERYHDAAVAAIGYERTLFVPDAGNWADLRIAFRTKEPDFAAWCHGAAGVGIGRALALPHLSDARVRAEITTAVETTLAIGFGMNHSLCHGDVGNLELLSLAADALGEPAWRVEAYRRMGGILDAIDNDGWVTGLPHGIEAPGLLVGLAGTGHGMLRLAAPDRVPAVLWLAPPQT
jgi:type 2 lantibiotic biosynthesis protein LanM